MSELTLDPTLLNELSTQNQEQPHTHQLQKHAIQISWAQNENEVREAQQLRYKVFAEEMGAHLPSNYEKVDKDVLDQYCDHLLIRDTETLKVIGTYRVLPPHKAREVGFYYSDMEFNLDRLSHLADKMVEVGRSCVHKDYRTGGVIMALWSGLAQYMQKHGYEVMIGCASVPMGDGGHYAASLAKKINASYLSSIEYRVTPKLPLPIHELDQDLDVEPPALLKGYLRIGAKVCGDPAWDPDFNTADFLTMLFLKDINSRYAKHFLT